MSCPCRDRRRSGMRQPGRHGPPPSALRSGSFGGCPSVRADGCVRAAAESSHAGACEIARSRLEVAALDPRDRLHDDGTAALEVLGAERLLSIFLEARRLADGEDILAHVPPDPVLRVPEGEESRLKAEGFAFV